MATVNKFGDDVKFLIEYKESGIDLTRNSYETIAKAITNTAIVGKLYSVRVYSKEGDLLCFYEKKADKTLVMGFLNAGTFHYRVFQEGETYDQIKPIESPSIDGLSLSAGYDSPMPGKNSNGFAVAGGHLSLKSIIPVYANVYNSQTEQTEPAQFGFVVAVEQLESGFVVQMDRITGMEMDLFVGDTFSAGDFSNYTKVDITAVSSTQTDQWASCAGRI